MHRMARLDKPGQDVGVNQVAQSPRSAYKFSRLSSIMMARAGWVSTMPGNAEPTGQGALAERGWNELMPESRCAEARLRAGAAHRPRRRATLSCPGSEGIWGSRWRYRAESRHSSATLNIWKNRGALTKPQPGQFWLWLSVLYRVLSVLDALPNRSRVLERSGCGLVAGGSSPGFAHLSRRQGPASWIIMVRVTSDRVEPSHRTSSQEEPIR